MAPPKFSRGRKDEDKERQKRKRKLKQKQKHKEAEQDEEEDEEEENQTSDDTSSTGEEMTDSEFERQLSAIEAAREDIKRQRHLRKERFSLMFSEYQEIIDEMDRSLEKAEAANERYQNILRLLDEQCNRSFQGYEKIAKLTINNSIFVPRGRAESEPVSALRKSPNGLRSVDKFPKRLGRCDGDGDVAERPKASSPDALKRLESSPAKSDSSSESSRSSSSVKPARLGGCKAVMKKPPPPFVPRLDLSGTGATAGAVMENPSSTLQQKPAYQLQCDPFENPGRRTSRRPDSARLISADDQFGNNIDSARIMLSRIKRRAKGGSCGGETINEVSVTSNSIVQKPSDDMGQNVDGPSIREIAELAVVQATPESVATENTCNDVACRTPVHVLRRSMSPPVAESCNPNSEMFVTCNAAESAPKAQETMGGGDAIHLQASRLETRTQILLWSTREKLSTLKTLTNTMFLWEDHPAKCGALTSDGNVDLVLSSLTAAKESQRKLFDNLDGVPSVPRRSICCSAVRELVRAYRPERLVPTSFINDHLVSQSLQHTIHQRESSQVIVESSLEMASAETLRSAQDSEAAEFWQALVHHVVSVADHKMATADQSAKEYAEVLLHEMREADIVAGDAKLARLELKAFLTRCFRIQSVSGKDFDITRLPLLRSDTTCTQEGSATSKENGIASGRQVRDIVVTRGKNINNLELPLVASKHSRRSSLSNIFNSLKFWKRKPQKLATDIDYLSGMLGMDRSERPQTSHDRKRYGFSLEI